MADLRTLLLLADIEGTAGVSRLFTEDGLSHWRSANAGN